MIDSIYLYYAQDINGECFLQPLKAYHGFFIKKIADNSGLRNLAWRITHIFTGIVAYPLFGVLTGFGLFIKFLGISGVQKHNKVEKSKLKVLHISVTSAGGFSDSIAESNIPPGWEKKIVREFKVTKRNVDSECCEINQTIDLLSSQFKKVYYDSQGSVVGHKGAITVQLQIMEKI
jgi:hypothetical protein